MTPAPQHNPTLLRVYLYFRAALAALLAVMFLVPAKSAIVGTFAPKLYFWTSLIYCGLCLMTLVFASAQQMARSFNRLTGSLILDIVSILILLHASGGIESGLGYLILIFVAISSFFIRGQLAIAFAAMTSLLLIGESIYLAATEDASNKLLFSSGVLGALTFVTAYTFQFLTEKLRLSHQEAAEQAAYAEHLQKLAQAIVARMRTGIIVFDQRLKIELINDSAMKMLDLPQNSDYRNVSLETISHLASVIHAWQEDPERGSVIEAVKPGLQVRLSLSSFDFGDNKRLVAYLEDYRATTQQAQQMKLASLGRLTASIAHEIRNPLGAISHAAQLLAESDTIDDQDVRFTEIIQQHSQRVNEIIESTLALSRRKEPQPLALDLKTWLPSFINQYATGLQASIDYKYHGTKHLVRMDPTHLSQVLTNLLDNGLRYSQKNCGEAKVTLLINESANDDTTYLEVIDYGKGIDEDSLQHIFDPFYTTDEKGSGLGLYISKELCEINQANLHYFKTPQGLSCFRIDFSHHQRMF